MAERPATESSRSIKAQGGAPDSVQRQISGKRVLIVDDDPISRNIVRDLLVTRGFEVDGSENPQTALEKVRRHHFDLLVLDIFLPGLDGRILHGSIEKINPALAERTVFISHWAPSGALGEYVLGHGLFLKKPFTGEELMRAIDATSGTGSGTLSK